MIDFVLSCRLPELPQLHSSRFTSGESVAHTRTRRSRNGSHRIGIQGIEVGGGGHTHRSYRQESLARCDCEERQVSGGLDGYCNSSDWFPSIIQSASSVKCLPDVYENGEHLPFTRYRAAQRVTCCYSFSPSGRRYLLYPWMFPPRRSSVCEIPQPKFSTSLTHCHTMELRHPTDSGHTLCPVDLLP